MLKNCLKKSFKFIFLCKQQHYLIKRNRAEDTLLGAFLCTLLPAAVLAAFLCSRATHHTHTMLPSCTQQLAGVPPPAFLPEIYYIYTKKASGARETLFFVHHFFRFLSPLCLNK
jgi:hypothetical protein